VTFRRCPAEFADLLTRRGLRVLSGADDACGALADPRRRFLSATDWIDRGQAAALRDLLDRRLLPAMAEMARPIPPETIWAQKRDYADLLPKCVRVLSAPFESRREPAWRAAEAIGLLRMLRSPSFVAFAQALAGRALARRPGVQALCYRPGDYAGPHHDHHPENPRARGGYVDVHLSLAGPGVARQDLVYARAGHFGELVALTAPATVSAYRLPFWHYVSPLVAKPGRAAQARRWVLLGTFLYRGSPAPAAVCGD
jgi:hypothetical protein